VTKYDEAMIDIETLDLKPSAVVLSVGVVRFSQVHGISGKYSQHMRVDLQSQFDAGRTVSQGTVLWWMDQSDEARSAAFGSSYRVPITAVWDQINDMLKGVHAVWAKSPSFDMVILESLFREVDADPPWHYRDLRDVRTIMAEARLDPNWVPLDMHGKIMHNAVDDCKWQILQVIEARNIINGRANP
jgi:hypothetical protein